MHVKYVARYSGVCKRIQKRYGQGCVSLRKRWNLLYLYQHYTVYFDPCPPSPLPATTNIQYMLYIITSYRSEDPKIMKLYMGRTPLSLCTHNSRWGGDEQKMREPEARRKKSGKKCTLKKSGNNMRHLAANYKGMHMHANLANKRTNQRIISGHSSQL